MIKHIVLFRWNDDAAESDRAATIAALRSLADTVPGVKELLVGADVAGRGTFHFGLSSDFASQEDLKNYVAHPLHQAVLADYIAKFVQPKPEVLDFVYPA